MATLLSRPLTQDELVTRSSLERAMEQFAQHRFSPSTMAPLSRDRPTLFVAAAMSLIDAPPSTESQRFLCNYLIGMPAFLAFIGHPDHLSRAELTEILRVLMEVDPMVDAKLAATLRTWRRDDVAVDKSVVLRILDVLDELSPGRRLVMTLSHLVHDDNQPVASKAALIMGRRVENASWVEGQLASEDARVRANVIESLWGVQSLQARKCLRTALGDPHNRVVGNALVGLLMVGDPEAIPRLQEMLTHPNPMFRATAAWAMGKTGCEDFTAALTKALGDQDPKVQAQARLSLSKLQAASASPRPGPADARKHPHPDGKSPASGAPEKADRAPVSEFSLRLDGTLKMRTSSHFPSRLGRRGGL